MSSFWNKAEFFICFLKEYSRMITKGAKCYILAECKNFSALLPLCFWNYSLIIIN